MRSKLLQAAVLLLALAGCKPAGGGGMKPIGLVTEIVADKADYRYLALARAEEPDRYAALAVLGSQEGCAMYGSVLDEYDVHDNINGSCSPDTLADFSGETFALISADMEDLPDANAIRTMAVNMAIAAVDTACSKESFDIYRSASKSSAKTIMLADPLLECYGRFDIDTLFALTSCKVKILSPVRVMYDKAGLEDGANIAFIFDQNIGSAHLYQTLNDQELKRRGMKNASAFVFATTPAARQDAPVPAADSAEYAAPACIGVMRSLLDAHAAAGHTEPLDAIMIGMGAGCADVLKEELRILTSPEYRESLTYGGMVDPKLTFIEEIPAVASACYRDLRLRNLFTHDIRRPYLINYKSFYVSKEAEDIFITVPTD